MRSSFPKSFNNTRIWRPWKINNVCIYCLFSGQKPKITYDQLITEALANAADKMLTLNDVYLAIAAKHPFYKIKNPSWKNCIRHNLSLNKNFIKLSDDKGSFWKLESGAESILLAKPDKKSARKVKGIQQNTANSSLATTSQQVVQVLPLNNGILTPPLSPGTYQFF